MKNFKLISFLIVLIFSISFGSFLYFTHKTQAQSTPSVVSGTATITNMGYIIYFSGPNANGGSVQYDSLTGGMTGYAWSPEYGWIHFTGTTGIALSLQNPNDTENIEWANGLIKLNGNDGGIGGNISYSVSFDPITGLSVNHWAWGGNVIGWVDFSGVSVGLSTTEQPSCTLTVTPTSVSTGDSSLLTWYGTNLASCTASGDWSGSKPISGGPTSTGALTTAKTYNLLCLGTTLGTSAACSASISVVNCSTNPVYPIPCCAVNPSHPSCTNPCPPGEILQSGVCVPIVNPTSCTISQLNDYSPDPITSINTPISWPCYCSIHQSESTPVDCVNFCLNNPSSCKKKPHYIEN